MDFIEAIKEMKRGKKVRRKGWDIFGAETYWYMGDNHNGTIKRFWKDHNNVPCFEMGNLERNDWEVFEEKTLSDKREKIGDCEYGYSEWNVKEALEEFRLWFKEKPKCYVGVEKKMKELFGEGLIK